MTIVNEGSTGCANGSKENDLAARTTSFAHRQIFWFHGISRLDPVDLLQSLLGSYKICSRAIADCCDSDLSFSALFHHLSLACHRIDPLSSILPYPTLSSFTTGYASEPAPCGQVQFVSLEITSLVFFYLRICRPLLKASIHQAIWP